MSTEIPADKQIILIVGGSQGIGFGLVEHALNGTGASWINKDALVVATGRDPTNAHDLIKLQEQYKDRLYIEKVDVSEPESIKTFVDHFNFKYPRLDVLFYNAGVYLDGNNNSDYTKIDPEVYIKSHIVNVIGPQHLFFGLTKLLDHTHKLLGGTIGEKPAPLPDDETKDDMTKVRLIFTGSGMSSMGGSSSHVTYTAPVYRTSKAALYHVVRDIAIKFPHYGTFLIHPGYVSTRMTEGKGQITINESVLGMYNILDKEAYAINSTKHLLCYDGTHLPW